MMRQLLDVVGETVELPLAIDLSSSPQREAIQLLVVSQVAEHRFHRGEAPGDHLFSEVAVDSHLHPVGVAFVSRAFALEEGYLPCPGPLGGAQALGS